MEGPEGREEEEGWLMRKPDEIKRGLECGDCTECPYYWGNSDDYTPHCKEVETDAIALIEDLQAKAPRWISVEEEVKPKLHQECLCVCSYKGTVHHEWDYMMVLRWMGNCNNGYADRPHFQHEGMNDMIVTHWMPLPEPPKEATP